MDPVEKCSDRALIIDWDGAFGTPPARERIERELRDRGYETRNRFGRPTLIAIPLTAHRSPAVDRLFAKHRRRRWLHFTGLSGRG